MPLSLHHNCCSLSISTFILATIQRLPGTCSLCMVPEVNFCLVFHTESETSASRKAFHLSYLSRVDEIICLSSSQRILGVPILLASFNQDVSSLSLHYFFCSHTKPIIELQDKDIRCPVYIPKKTRHVRMNARDEVTSMLVLLYPRSHCDLNLVLVPFRVSPSLPLKISPIR